MKFFNRFFLKIIILLIVLNALLVCDHYNLINFDEIKEEMYHNINFVRFTDKLIGDIQINKDDEISVNTNQVILEVDDKKRLILKSEEVFPLSKGQIIKIEKVGKESFKVYLQTNDNIYVYSNIIDINVNMYQVVSSDEYIGKTDLFDDYYYCFIEVLEDDCTFEKDKD